MHKVTISEKGQIAIPVELRRRYDLEKGDKLILRETETGITITPLAEKPLLQLKGKFKVHEDKPLTEELLKNRAEERASDK